MRDLVQDNFLWGYGKHFSGESAKKIKFLLLAELFEVRRAKVRGMVWSELYELSFFATKPSR